MRRLAVAALAACLLGASAASAFAAADLSGLNVYPNPVRRYQGQSAVTFDNLTAQATILIFSVRGELVREVEFSGAGFRFAWDLTNDLGADVASGVYIYVVKNEAGEVRSGKVALIR